MCGIFALIDESRTINKTEAYATLKRLIIDSSKRGRDSIGIAIFHNDKSTLRKKPYDPLLFIKKNEHKLLIDEIYGCKGVIKGPLVILGQSRLATNGSPIIEKFNQPVISFDSVGVFNGIVTQIKKDNEWVKTETGLDASQNDTEIFFELKEKCKKENINIFSRILGSINFLLFNPKDLRLEFATNSGSLYKHVSGKKVFFTSESYTSLSSDYGTQVSLNKIHELNLEGEDLKSFSILKQDQKFNSIKRCSNCLLPSTHPYISFDINGKCNFCHTYQRQKFQGEELLKKELDKYRKSNGDYDCVVGLSGGRDSCYGLHLLKKKYGMNPIAYTYDWGLTTDISRRNQSILCGKLGVEHIIRSANLEQKRRFVRKNVNAWMKSPHLGMIPLFMAGDKEFFEYGRTLRKELNIDLTVLSSGHQLEQREFMIGFTGLRQPTLHNNPDFFHHPGFLKVKLALWYSLQYLKNPRYINESLFDSFNSFLISFVKSTGDFIYLFRYIPWEEELIEKTLKNEYEWESDSLYGKNQWRMGDGQTAFNNFIYYHIAGITEYDSFRSHQVREGLLDRAEALSLLKIDNQPKFEVIKQFCETIGIPYEETVRNILKIKPIF